ATLGVACAIVVADVWLAAALAVSLSILAMLLTNSLHPPGGAVALLPVLDQREHVLALGYQFVVAPVLLNVLVLLCMALLINNLLPGRRYPSRPVAGKDKQHRHEDPRPLDRLGINKDDLQQALKEMNVLLDVSKGDLDRVYRNAGMASYRRRMGELTCADIMSRDLITVEFGTELEEVWALLRFHKIGTIPVLDRARRVIGIVSLVDFLKRANLKTYDTFEDKLIKFIRRTPGMSSEKAEVAGQIMASPVFTVREEAHVLELVPLLTNKGLHQVPVVNSEDRLVGMVTQSDLIAALYHSGIP
ncbi:MAG: CBS domain-containing protein, partial [Gallionella sp.]|nr:CBS domain-containing protein [Gallionella sp.]